MGLGRLELPTSPLSGARSSHLSYRPILHRGIQLFAFYDALPPCATMCEIPGSRGADICVTFPSKEPLWTRAEFFCGKL